MATEILRTFQLLAVTPPALPHPSVAIAASRAGGLGVVDLEHVRHERAARAAIAKLSEYGWQPCGIKLDGRALDFMASVISDLPARVAFAILIPGDPDETGQAVRLLRRQRLGLMLEATGLAEARLGEQLGVDGLVVKGHEAGGRVGEETTFILLQRVLATSALPVWAHGGIGLHTAAACYAAGALGVVLDGQLALTRESRLPEAVRAAIARMDGSETMCVGTELGESWRVFVRPGLGVVEALQHMGRSLAHDPRPRPEILAAWRGAVRERVGWGASGRHLWLLGQDAAFAAPLAASFRTVGGILAGVREAIANHVRAARASGPLDEEGPLARSHRTRYPIVQGPMTRVSDRAEFARRVADAGALPFLALALMRAPEVEALLRETRQLLADRPWGVGILGFVPLDLRQEQIEVMRAYRPSFALIAGGRPDQAGSLEKDGIPTYLHVPSPGLLRMFLADGARRFVFEGRECGGHVGPRSSFVLWNSMIDVLLEALPERDAEACHVLFAGGIHDGRSAAMVAGMAAPLAERGVRIGVLLGTAYLFTEEAVASGAILPGFQEEAIRCDRTVLLETGPGHAIRCAPTPYAEEFEREKQRLLQEGKSADETRQALEELNIGRLRIASKGIDRHPGGDPSAPRFVTLRREAQHAHGMYMIGQVAALRRETCRVEDLHREISVAGSRRLEALPAPEPAAPAVVPARRPSDIAIVGMSAILPKAADVQRYWENILNKVDAIVEIPRDRWNWELYYDPDPKAGDKIYSKWGGFIDDVPFDPVEWGIPPNSLPSVDPMQLLALEAARAALADAGYLERPFDRSRASVILGASGGTGDLGASYLLRASLPRLFGDAAPEIVARAHHLLPEWTEDSFAGLLLNVTAGRIANRFDFGGLNYIVDAACASALAAVHLAVKELESDSTDLVLTGGVDTVQSPFGYLCFSKTQALSPTGRPRPFDASADGIALGEGVVMLVLKRLADAERDGDRIYAVIRGIDGSSDGKAKGLTAPRPEGQILALRRAYARAGVSPASVGLFEAHGTGTVVGDRTEALALSTFLEEAGAAPGSGALGSVKSMIGHTKAAAGVAGLVKVALALFHKVLPPTMGVTRPTPGARLGDGPLYINSETRPWIHGLHEQPRRASVSAFGFGGTNFHAVLEEYRGETWPSPSVCHRWPAELLFWSAVSGEGLASELEALTQSLDRGARPALGDLAYTLWQRSGPEAAGSPAVRVAIVASSLDDLREKLGRACEALRRAGPLDVRDGQGIYITDAPLATEGRIAFLFPGQGSQYPNMLRDLAVHFPEVREAFERGDGALRGRFPRPLSSHVFPPPPFSLEDEQAQRRALTDTRTAQPALGAAGMGLCHLLGAVGVRPDLTAGHSYGEYVALCAAGVFDEETLALLSEARGRAIIETASRDPGTMAAIPAGPELVAELLRPLEGVWLANFNAPQQTVISGTREGVEQAIGRLKAQGVLAVPIPVACAFHSPLIAPARDRLAQVLAAVRFRAPRLPVFSNASAGPYPDEPAEISALLGQHLVTPVRFTEQVTAMYDAGARIFVEVGPRNVLTGLTQQILGARRHLALAADVPGKPGLAQLLHLLAGLAVHGVPVQLDRLYEGRGVRRLNLETLVEEEGRGTPLSPTAWLVNGGRARPARETRDPARATPPPPPAPRGATAGGATGGPTATVPLTRGTVPSVNRPQAAEVSDGSLAGSGDEVDQAILQFQQVMQRFLETEQSVMLRYLESVRHRAPLAVTPVAGATPIPPSGAPALEAAPSVEAAPVRPPRPISGEAAWTPPDTAQLTTELLRIVSERTGYPSEMLGLDMDMEADLGIDSIKRVEILGALRQAAVPPGHPLDEHAMERLTTIKTLRGIVSWLEGARGTSSPLPEVPADRDATPARIEAAAIAESRQIQRFVLRPVDAPLPSTEVERLLPEGVFVLTGDERGVAEALAVEIRRRGGRVVLVRSAAGTARDEPAVYQADLTDPAAAEAFIVTVREREGPIRAVVHLLPLARATEPEVRELAAWRERLRRELKGLFYLARAAAGDLKGAAESGGAWLLAVTAAGGEPNGGDAAALPGAGAIAGFIKTAALEWPRVCSKVVHLDVENPPATLAAQVFQEMAASDGPVEVGYRGQRRWLYEPVPRPLNESEPWDLDLDGSSVVLLTGGARGITAEIAGELAERYRPTLLLVGSSPLPGPEESADTVSLTSAGELKSALIARLEGSGEPVTPRRVDAEYRRLLKEREIRRTLARVRAAGATTRYYPVDVRDAGAMAKLIDQIYREYGRLDAVIHGAGVIEDKLIEAKSPESFDRVFDTKVDGAFLLSRLVRPDQLKFFALFASAAGRFGNRGQCDYAAANELFNWLAARLDRSWPGRVVSINWGPWAATGMVSSELGRALSGRGIELIPADTGRRLFVREIGSGGKGESDVILAGGTWAAIAGDGARGARAGLPLLARATLQRSGPAIVRAIRVLDPAHDLFLGDHRLDGKPVLPLAVALELMAEVVQNGWPDLRVVGVRELQILRGVILDGGPKTVWVDAHRPGEPAGDRLSVDVAVEVGDPEGSGPPYYRATVELASRWPDPPSGRPSADGFRPFPLTVEGAYRQWLFQGPLLQGLVQIDGIAPDGMLATCRPSSPRQCLTEQPDGEWLIDPVVLDSGLQLVILWTRAHLDMTPLPSRFRRYRRFGSLSGSEVRCRLTVAAKPPGPISYSLLFSDPDARPLGLLEGLECPSSKALNRLGGGALRD